MLSADQADALAAVPLNVTVPDPCTAPKPDPVIVTEAPTSPDDGLSNVIVGCAGLALTPTFVGALGA
jgi:hypothetical protein